MGFAALRYCVSKVIFLVELNLYSTTAIIPSLNTLNVESLLFLLYINDLYDVSKAFDFILFADDTGIFFLIRTQNQLREIVNTELKKPSSWFQAPKLSINIKK